MKVSFSEYQYAKNQIFLLIQKNKTKPYSNKDKFLKKIFSKDITNFKK